MANGNRWSMSYRRRFTAIALATLGLFVASYGVGQTNPAVIALGLAVGILGPAVLLLTAVRATTRRYIFGTAHVYSASPPPSAGMVGRAELHLAVFAEGIDGVAVRVLDPAVPVSKWPDDGATLPIEVVANNPRKVRVLWDQVVTHAQAAGEDLYPQYVENLPEDLDDDYDDLPPDDFLDDETELPPMPPAPPARMPSGSAGMGQVPAAPVLVTPPKRLVTEGAGAPVRPVSPATRVEPVSPAPVMVTFPDAETADEGRPLDDPSDLDYLDDLDDLEDLDDLDDPDDPDAPGPAGPEPGAPAGPELRPGEPAGPDLAADGAARSAPVDGPPLSLPLPRRRPSPHLRRPSPRPRPRRAVDDRTDESRAESGGVRTGGINPVYVEETPAEPPPEWPLNNAAEAATPVRPESRPEPDYTEVVSGTVEPGSGGSRAEALSGSIVDDHAYSDRSETDRMTFDRSSFRIVAPGPMDAGSNGYADGNGYAGRPEPEPAPEPEPEPAPERPESRVGDPFNVIPLRIRRRRSRPAGTKAEPASTEPEPGTEPPVVDDAAPDATEAAPPEAAPDAAAPETTAPPATDEPPADDENDDDERNGDAPNAGPGTDQFSTEPTNYLTAPSAGLSQLGSGGFSVTLFVRELARSIAFYRDVLGLAEVDTGKGSAVLARGDSRILLKRVTDLQPVDRRIVHLNLEVPDVQAAYEELKTKGVEFVHKPRVVSQGEQLELWAAMFRDPDGHAIALTRWELRR